MARSSLIVMSAFVVSKAVGLLRERAIAHRFGASADYDAYVAAFNVPDLLFTLIAGGALMSAFLPVFSTARARGEEDEAWTIASAVTNLVFLVTLVTAGLAAAGAPWLVSDVLAPGFGAEQQALAVDLMRIVLISTLVFAVSGIQMGILNAFQHFLLPALAPIFYNIGILIGAIWLAPRFGIRGLAYGVVLGALLHLAVKIPGLIRYGFCYRPVLGLRLSGVREVLALMWPRVLTLATVKAVFVVNTHLASQLPHGRLSALNYAWVVSQMPQTVFGTAIAIVVFPTLAELAALDRRAELRATTLGTLRVLIALSVPAAISLWMLAGPVIDVLLRTGAFDAEASQATRFALRMFALGLVGHVTLEVIARTYYAQKDTVTPLRVGAVAMTLNILLAFWLVGPLAQGGLALANAIAVTFEVVLLLWLLSSRLGGIEIRELAAPMWRAGVAGLVMIVAMRTALAFAGSHLALPQEGNPLTEGLVFTAVGGSLGFAAYLAVASALGLVEIGAAGRLLSGRLGSERATRREDTDVVETPTSH